MSNIASVKKIVRDFGQHRLAGLQELIVLPTLYGVKSRTLYYCTKNFTFGCSGSVVHGENVVNFKSECRNV